MKKAMPFRKKLLMICVIILAATGLAYFFFARFLRSPDLSKSLKKQLTDLVAEKSHGLYQLQIGSIVIDGAEVSARINDISLSIDSAVLQQLREQNGLPVSLYSFTLKSITLNKADILAFISAKTAVLNKVEVSGGSLTVTRILKGLPAQTAKSPKETIKETMKTSVVGISIDTLHADNIDIVYTNLKHQSRTVKNVFLDLYQFSIDSNALEDSNRFFLAKKLRLSIDSVRFPIADNFYHLGARKMTIAISDSSITSIQDLYLKSPKNISLEKLAAGLSKQQDVFDMKVKQLMIGNLNLQALLEDSSIQADLLIINDPEIAVFRDKSKPQDLASKIGKFPHQMLLKLPFSINLPDILVEGGNISYAERNEQGDGIGKVTFNRLKGKIGPVLKGLPGPKKIQARFTALFMNTTGITAGFEFPESNDGSFSANAKISPFPVTIINAAALPLGNIQLKTGRVTQLNFTIRGNNTAATGTTLLNYQDLTIDVMKTDDNGGRQKNKLMSMVANTFMLHENNLAGDKNKDAFTVTYQRVPSKSFFNLIWKTVFYGVKANTGVGAKGKDKDRARIH